MNVYSLPLLGLLLATMINAQISSSNSDLSSSATTSIPDLGGDLLPTGSQVSYISYPTTITLSSSTLPFTSSNRSITLLSSTNSSTIPSESSSISSTSPTATILVGTNSDTTPGSTSTAPGPTNTQACNNYPEFCSRKYSNITFVAAHNSPFVAPNNAASNQALGVFDQLDDGIRMLQGQTHLVNNTVYYCHTSCDLLNVGTAESYFKNISTWLAANPYDVVTVLIGNADFITVENYTAPLINSGLSRYAYVPPQIPMNTSDWPTLASLILSNSRAIIFMDYNANQSSVPYVLDEFSQIFETPFSPTNDSFPCTAQRPPNLNREGAEQRLYIANHNLNTEISLAGFSLLVPTTVELNVTNAVSGFGSLGLAANNCVAAWNKPPNFLLVDYYNEGNGSVFEVAAQHNNVTYTRKCCGLVPSAAIRRNGNSNFRTAGSIFFIVMIFTFLL